jgi:hypothetical protein
MTVAPNATGRTTLDIDATIFPMPMCQEGRTKPNEAEIAPVGKPAWPHPHHGDRHAATPPGNKSDRRKDPDETHADPAEPRQSVSCTHHADAGRRDAQNLRQ